MLIEATENSLTYKWPGGEIRLEPGKPINVPTQRAARLLAKVGDKARVVGSPEIPLEKLVPGTWIEFHSPVFGKCTAQVDSMEGDTIFVNHHLVLKGFTQIPTGWVWRVLTSPPDER